jgi:NAD(P)H-dependent FMN reductase
MSDLNVQIIVGTTRQGRVSDRVGKWVEAQAAGIEGVNAEVVDLADYPLTFFDEAIPPKYNPERTPTPEAKKWLDKIAQADAYVIVTAEYNRSMPAVLKNALDYVGYEMSGKPAALVAHGSTGGAQAVASLRITVPGAGAFTIPGATFFSDYAAQHIDEAGNLSEELKAKPNGPQTSLQATLAELVEIASALKVGRAQA